MFKRRAIAGAVALLALAGCVPPEAKVSTATAPARGFLASLNMSGLAPDTSPIPPMRWDHRAEAPEWTDEALEAVARRDDIFAARVPADIASWCPGYETASLPDRRAFWVGMLSALAKHESTWNPRAAGGGGKWIGLTQISPQTARGHGCQADTASELKDGAENLRCAVAIAAVDVARDGMVVGGGNRGLGRDWAPFRNAAKREDMRTWIRQQPYCQGDGSPVVVSTKGN